MRSILLGLLLLLAFGFAGGLERPAAADSDNWFMAFCSDGDGALSQWVNSRNDAYLAGRDHERAFKGHSWEVLVHHGAVEMRPANCAIVTDGEKPGTVRLLNTCNSCRKFLVARTMSDGTVKSKEFNVKEKSGRFFRKIEGAVITVAGEANCNP
jgi:hypothetical protein